MRGKHLKKILKNPHFFLVRNTILASAAGYGSVYLCLRALGLEDSLIAGYSQSAGGILGIVAFAGICLYLIRKNDEAAIPG